MIYIKYAKWIGIGLVLFCAFILMPYFYKRTQELKAQNNELADYATSKDTEVKYYVNKYNQQVAETETIRMSNESLKQVKEDFADLAEKFEGVKKNLKNVENVTRLTAEAVANFEVPTSEPRIDTTLNEMVRDFDNNEEWFRVAGRVSDNKVYLDSLHVPVPLDVVTYWKRKKILFLRIGRKEYSTSATSENPYITVTKLKAIVKKQ